MLAQELMALFDKSRRRYHLCGNEQNGVLAALDLEGRLYAVQDGLVRNRVNAEAISSFSTRAGYINPGGDGLWPAPEGSRLGYEYATENWRVPPGLTNVRWLVTKQTADSVHIEAEVDLINAEGLGVPCLFERRVAVATTASAMTATVEESITYLGKMTLSTDQCLLVPWTLCQFDCDSNCELRVWPVPTADDLWDLYDWDSGRLRRRDGQAITVAMKTDHRFQLGLSAQVQELRFLDHGRGFQALRTVKPLASGWNYIDIADRAPTEEPTGRPVNLSAYCDPSGFMEIEAAGGAPEILRPGSRSALTVTTAYSSLL